jgi:hypothetical protein
MSRGLNIGVEPLTDVQVKPPDKGGKQRYVH